VKRFISEPQPPPSGIEIPMEGKAKERREVGEGHDTVVVEDSSEDDDEGEETLQDRFQLLSVRNMVPTLTSRKRRGLSLNGRC
jgi:hypothetical protein